MSKSISGSSFSSIGDFSLQIQSDPNSVTKQVEKLAMAQPDKQKIVQSNKINQGQDSDDDFFNDFEQDMKVFKSSKTKQIKDIDFIKADFTKFFYLLQNNILLDFFYKLSKKHIPKHLINKRIISNANEWDDQGFFNIMREQIKQQLDIVQSWVDWNIRDVENNIRLKKKIKQKEEIKRKHYQDIQILLNKIIQKNRQKTEQSIIEEFKKSRQQNHQHKFQPTIRIKEFIDDDQMENTKQTLLRAKEKLKVQNKQLDSFFSYAEQQFRSTVPKFNL